MEDFFIFLFSYHADDTSVPSAVSLSDHKSAEPNIQTSWPFILGN
jgi:hypothetical protein